MENIEKIRKMSVNELAEFLHGLTSSLAVKLNGEYVINEIEQIKKSCTHTTLLGTLLKRYVPQFEYIITYISKFVK